MSEQLLAPLTALGNDTPVVVTIGGITICENPDLTIASLAARKDRGAELHSKLQADTKVQLPDPGKMMFAEDVAAIWTGVEQWLLLAPISSHPDYAAEVKTVVADSASVTEQTDGWVVFDIAGNNLIPMLERLCNLNSKALSSGEATRCLIEHLGCLIICRESGREFTILGPRSSAASLHHSLVTAAKSIA
ncbi:hypothetical protein [Sneathiella sp.]|uniref:sarcosine oxidase subunit gamma n=1 Tax=Sneathiella sp. TaxID=1964365 RepID=UPI0025E3EBD0|nr:hypothetical protein [Sneathiella sp.]